MATQSDHMEGHVCVWTWAHQAFGANIQAVLALPGPGQKATKLVWSGAEMSCKSKLFAYLETARRNGQWSITDGGML